MARKPSPLRTAKANSVSVCGKMLSKGQNAFFPESAVGPREIKLEKRGKIRILPAPTKGQVQIVCTLR